MVGTKNGLSLASMLVHPVFLSSLFSLLIAQFMKVLVNLYRFRSKSFRDVLSTFFWRTGGMPSSHSALAASLCTSIGINEGFNSTIFILSLFVSLVIIRDAVGVRRATGLQARCLNQLGKELASRFGIPFQPVKEVHGHSVPEVSVGIAIGISIGLAFSLL